MTFIVDTMEIQGVVNDSEDILSVEAIIAREMVQDYPKKDAKIYKPGSELETATFTANGAYISEGHPGRGIAGIVTEQDEIAGFVREPEFLDDESAIKARLDIHKDRVPEETVEQINDGDITDVSIGFHCTEKFMAGEFDGEEYDRIHKDIVIDHVALAPPGKNGRCSSEDGCGIMAQQQEEADTLIADIAVDDEELGAHAMEVLQENDIEAEKRPCNCGEHHHHISLDIASGTEGTSGDFNNDSSENSTQEDKTMSDDQTINDFDEDQVKEHSAVQDIIEEKETLQDEKESLEEQVNDLEEERDDLKEKVQDFQQEKLEEKREQIVDDYPVNEEKVSEMDLEELETLEETLDVENDTTENDSEDPDGTTVETDITNSSKSDNKEEGALETESSRSMKA